MCSCDLRRKACANVDVFGIEIDEKVNQQAIGGKEMLISTPESKVKVYVIPTNEELVMARDTVRVILDVPQYS